MPWETVIAATSLRRQKPKRSLRQTSRATLTDWIEIMMASHANGIPVRRIGAQGLGYAGTLTIRIDQSREHGCFLIPRRSPQGRTRSLTSCLLLNQIEHEQSYLFSLRSYCCGQECAPRLNRHSPDDIQIRGDCTTVPLASPLKRDLRYTGEVD